MEEQNNPKPTTETVLNSQANADKSGIIDMQPMDTMEGVKDTKEPAPVPQPVSKQPVAAVVVPHNKLHNNYAGKNKPAADARTGSSFKRFDDNPAHKKRRFDRIQSQDDEVPSKRRWNNNHTQGHYRSTSGNYSRQKYHGDPLNQNNPTQMFGYNQCLPNRGGARPMGFRLLEELSQLDSFEALVQIKNRMGALREHLESNLENDFLIVLLKVLANICESSFDDSKGHIIVEVCNSNFTVKLQEYVMALPDADKCMNKYFWSDPNKFFECLLTFCESTTLLSPSTALHKCRVLIKRGIDASLNGLKDEHNFTVAESVTQRLNTLKTQLMIIEKKKEEEKKKHGATSSKNQIEAEPPPNDFRELSVLPLVEDLRGQMPYVRPNIVDGGYVDVEHYLDVQFRLLREDCYGPLRDGIRQYLKEPNRKHLDNIRVYRKVKMLEPYYSTDKIGILVQFDDMHIKKKRRINWAHSKRFMFGNLLLFTNNCSNFVLATVIDRDTRMLEQGLVPVSVYGNDSESSMNLLGKSFTMIESGVYFEPYYHVLKALQDPVFAQHLAMKNYIVHVQPTSKSPDYLEPDTKFNVNVNHEDGLSQDQTFTVLEEESWPSPQDLGLDQTQYDAYKLCLTHEFSVIQGPPGTGKTYLGVLAARTLLENLDLDGCAMLVICYTNHALDQFLEAILNITDSVVRIGGQSRSEVLEQYNLNKLRMRRGKATNFSPYYRDIRRQLQDLTQLAGTLQRKLNIVNDGLVRCIDLADSVDEVKILMNTYNNMEEDPIITWLFQGAEYLYGGGDLSWLTDRCVESTRNENANDEHNRLPNLMDIDFEGDAPEKEMQNIFVIDKITEDIREWRVLLQKHCTDNHKHTLQSRIRLWETRLNCFQDNRVLRTKDTYISLKDRPHPAQFSLVERWALYYKWVKMIKANIIAEIVKMQQDHRTVSDQYEEARMIVDLDLIKNTRVVGMTTTGAARLQKLIRSLKPPIVIVEEAAEVLESHIVVSLTSRCQHLILIGDHQQLRPSASNFKLEKHYNMKIALFERMISNGIHSRRLGVQHRMRPSIASLIVPAIYPELQNHADVERYPSVRGLAADLFFLTHDKHEDGVDDENSSRQNTQEADLLLGLANYIMQQGYKPEDVTILAAYSGQMFYMKRQRNSFSHLRNVKITVVDNYQGEESKIILLSLVRNNAEGNIGFLGNANRVCVALSRAKEGFYIMGNIEMLKSKSDLWKTISKTLEKQEALGASITLRCESHPDQIIEVREVSDFRKVPEGGCLLPCGSALKCGHICPRICHAYDRKHENVICPQNCERVVCDLGHVCPLRCAEECAPCKVQVNKQLPCGHEKTLSCHLDPKNPSVKCLNIVEAILPACGHMASKACHVEVNKVSCEEPCIDRLPCGHACTRHCHKTDDPDHVYFLCLKPCTNEKKGCTTEPMEDGELEEHTCQRKCYESCDECNVQVIKIIPACGHEAKILCKYEPEAKYCPSKCERTLPCGHKCTLKCKEPCHTCLCKEPAAQPVKSPCGHSVYVPCYTYNGGVVDEKTLLQHCTAPCEQRLACGHCCSGTCGTCRQGRLHAPCTRPCRRPLLCGHLCEEPCNEVCPPCKKPCDVRCSHTRCRRPCGQPCTPCKEKCKRACIHGSCTRMCGQPCSRAACDKPCPLKRRRCGHRCRGLCGEPCPDICNICDPDNFPKDILEEAFAGDAKLIKLQDCKGKNGHYMEVEFMDQYMKSDKETIMIRACPYCRTPIINTSRYKDLVNATFRHEIDPIKSKVYGNRKRIYQKRRTLRIKTIRMLEKYINTASDIETWITALNTICKAIEEQWNSVKKRYFYRQELSLPELNMHSLSLDILDMLAECYEQYKKEALTKLRTELIDQITMICHALAANTCKASVQQQTDIDREIKRTRAIVQLAKITSHILFAHGEEDPVVKEANQKATGLIISWNIFDDEKARLALEKLQESVKLSGIVKKAERNLVVKAIGLKQGHWFKCPNGHFYCIGECGGAMQTGKCVECGAAIGGGRHTLLAGNQHAPEIDGSAHPAWSNTANNMRNFQL